MNLSIVLLLFLRCLFCAGIRTNRSLPDYESNEDNYDDFTTEIDKRGDANAINTMKQDYDVFTTSIEGDDGTAIFDDDFEPTLCDTCHCMNETATLIFVDCNYPGHSIGLDHIPPWPTKYEVAENISIVVDMSDQEIQEIRMFSTIPVINLDISQNDLRLIWPDSLLGVSKTLQKLDLSDNKLDADSLQKDSFRGSLESSGYYHFHLIQLSLARNRLHTVDFDLFEYLVYLTDLDISGNPLAPLTQDFIDAINSIKSLQSLTIRDIGLTHVAIGFLSGLEDLIYLDLSGNLLTQVDPQLRTLISLQSLNMDSNQLQILDQDSFTGLHNLKNLSVSECSRLKYVEQLTLQDQNKLQFVRMKNNRELSWISPDAWLSKTNITTYLIELDISGNDMRYLPSTLLHSLDDWKQIQHLNIQGNPWMCDCHNEWLIYTLVPSIHQNNPSLTQNILCGGPKDTSLIKEEMMVVQELTNHTDLQCTHKKFSFYKRDFNIEEENLEDPRPRKQVLPLALTIICVTAVMGTAAMVGYLYMEKKRVTVFRIRRPNADNPQPRVAYIPANLGGRGYSRQHDEPVEQQATSFTDIVPNQTNLSGRGNSWQNDETVNQLATSFSDNPPILSNQTLQPSTPRENKDDTKPDISIIPMKNDGTNNDLMNGIKNKNFNINDEM